MWRTTLLLFTGLLQACSQPTAEEAVHYQTVRALQLAASDSYAVERLFVGEVRARQQTDIGFELPGTVTQISVAEGGRVAAGEVMGRQDTRLLRLQKKELLASLDEAQAQLLLANSSLKRQKGLKVSGFSADQRIDELKAEVKGLSATIARLQASLDANQTRQEKALLKAPFDGVVSKRYIDRGAVVAAGTPVIQLLQSGTMELEIGVPVRLADQVQIGDRYPVVVNTAEGQAELISLGANIDSATRTVPAWFALTNISARDGELATITLSEHHQHRGYWLPFSSVTEGMRGKWVVYGLSAAAKDLYEVQRHAIEILYTSRDEFFVSGELDGLDIVSGGLHRIVPGQQVRVAERTVTAVED